MRTTVDLDESLLKRLRDEAHVEGVPFRTHLHRVIRRGLDSGPPAAESVYHTPVLPVGRVREGIDLVKSMRLATALEDEEIVQEIMERR